MKYLSYFLKIAISFTDSNHIQKNIIYFYSKTYTITAANKQPRLLYSEQRVIWNNNNGLGHHIYK